MKGKERVSDWIKQYQQQQKQDLINYMLPTHIHTYIQRLVIPKHRDRLQACIKVEAYIKEVPYKY